MSQGEKKVFVVIGIAFAAIIALTIYLEIQHQESHKSETATANKSDSEASGKTDPVTVIPSGLSPYDLPDADSRGATMLTLYCAQCHELPPPAMHSKNEWDDVIKRMQKNMQSTRGSMLRRVLMPPEKDWQILKVYLETHAQVALNDEASNDFDSTAGKAFKATCSQCHAPPNPKTHTSNEWPRVVLRMKSHIIRTGKKMPDQETLLLIIDFLQKHGKDI